MNPHDEAALDKWLWDYWSWPDEVRYAEENYEAFEFWSTWSLE